MNIVEKSKAFLKQFTKGIIESPAINQTVKSNQFVTKATAVPPTKNSKAIKHKQSGSKHYTSNSRQIKNYSSDRHL